MEMEKYKRAARTILTPKVGYGLADELKRAGFWIKTVLDKPQAVDILLRNHTVDMMDKRRIECLAFVLDNSDFRIADAFFPSSDILMGKARKEAISVVGKWKDRDSWRRSLDWDDESEDANVDDITNASDADCIKNEKNGARWKLESSDSKATSITIVLKTVGGSMFDIFCD
ncbi:C2H2-type domain-containing protein [Citrus sinensis]|uniref:C2H2-type domain-containing protein n=1 Tax=Citrus sinensis TaxID=2711 RepID=A0ACB8II19_CITSI|nr:C2H2-type domain-containing protein [Citrus sinensis]